MFTSPQIPARAALLIALALTGPLLGAADDRSSMQSDASSISSISPATVTRAGRFRITGSGFGAQQGTGSVTVGGVVAPVSRWNDTAITAYVPEGAPLGADAVQVTASSVPSNAGSLQVTARAAIAGHVKWRFMADGYAIRSRPAVGPDGTIYALDTDGRMYAITPAGGLRWIFNGGGGNAAQPVSVGNDGTIYFSSLATVYAIRPDGTLKWFFKDPGSALIFAGPTAGPDGNIYAVSSDLDVPNGLGAFVLSPQGNKISNLPGFNVRLGYDGIEIVFASGHWYFTNNASGAVTPAGSLWAFNLGGTTLAWRQPAERQPRIQPPNNNIVVGDGNHVHPGLQDFTSTGNLVFHVLGEGTPIDAQTDVDVDSAGNIYLGTLTFGTGSHFRSLNPNGTLRWQFRDDDIATSPAVSPLGNLVLYSAAGYNMPSHVNALNTANGALLWRENLTVEKGGNIQISSIPRFANDGSAAYLGSVVNATNGDVYSYLYAFVTGSTGFYAADGIDDTWQVQYFGQNNPQADPNADPDGDGRTNLQEFTEGTVPTNSNDHLSIQVTPVPGQPAQKKIVLSPILSGRSYALEYCSYATDTGAQVWYPLAGAAQSDNGTVRTVIDNSAHTGSTCFYRIETSKP